MSNYFQIQNDIITNQEEATVIGCLFFLLRFRFHIIIHLTQLDAPSAVNIAARRFIAVWRANFRISFLFILLYIKVKKKQERRARSWEVRCLMDSELARLSTDSSNDNKLYGPRAVLTNYSALSKKSAEIFYHTSYILPLPFLLTSIGVLLGNAML